MEKSKCIKPTMVNAQNPICLIFYLLYCRWKVSRRECGNSFGSSHFFLLWKGVSVSSLHRAKDIELLRSNGPILLSAQWRRYIALPMYNGSNNGVGAAVFGNGGCNYANWNWLGNNNGNRNSNAFRCVH